MGLAMNGATTSSAPSGVQRQRSALTCEPLPDGYCSSGDAEGTQAGECLSAGDLLEVKDSGDGLRVGAGRPEKRAS
jgi:hypothetical protein